MKRLSKDRLITLIIILCILLIAGAVLIQGPPETDEEISKCIGKNSELYTKLGCHACEIQEEMFGENYQYLNVIDCFFEQEKCGSITSSPTWIIKGKKYEGIQLFGKLKEWTGC